MEPIQFDCSLDEGAVSEDPTSNNSNVVPTFAGYSPSANVTGEVVYANYGTIADFQYLQSINISVSGKIVIVRYGKVFRGLKAMLAQQYGAIGIIIYSDPYDDGYFAGDEYPEGPWRSNKSAQRGSNMFLSICPGNPDPDRLQALCFADTSFNYSSFNYTTLPSIPVQPISWSDAQPILGTLGGQAVTRE